MPVGSYNTNPALNTLISGIDISEGSSAAGYNNALRQIMADIAVWTAASGVTFPVAIAQGGTGQTTATAAFNALAAAGGTVTGQLKQAALGGYTYWAFSGAASGGKMFIQAMGGADPTVNQGDMLFEW